MAKIAMSFDTFVSLYGTEVLLEYHFEEVAEETGMSYEDYLQMKFDNFIEENKWVTPSE